MPWQSKNHLYKNKLSFEGLECSGNLCGVYHVYVLVHVVHVHVDIHDSPIIYTYNESAYGYV